MAKEFSQRKLDVLRREWQKLLRLQDWRITARFVNYEDLADDRVGECSNLADSKEADIKIIHPEQLKDASETDKDLENTLVHELLHCHFSPFRSNEEGTIIQHEQAIVAITEALVGLKRRKRAIAKRK